MRSRMLLARSRRLRGVLWRHVVGVPLRTRCYRLIGWSPFGISFSALGGDAPMSVHALVATGVIGDGQREIHRLQVSPPPHRRRQSVHASSPWQTWP